MTTNEQVRRLAAEAMARIRRGNSRWKQDAVWLDDAVLVATLREVGGASRFRRHGDAALPLLRLTLERFARRMPQSIRGFRSVAEERFRVEKVLIERLGTGRYGFRYPQSDDGSPSVYYLAQGRGGRDVVIRVSDHPPSNRANETLIDISPMGYSAFSDWFLRRLDELGVGINRD